MENSFIRGRSSRRPYGTLITVFIVVLCTGASGKDGGTTTSTCNGLCLTLRSATVPPGGLFQFQMLITEPKPVIKGSPAVTLSSAVFGSGVGASVTSPSGQSSGIVQRTTSGFNVILVSPDALLGTSGDMPILTLALPVRPDAPVGTQVPLSLNLSDTVFVNSSGQPYSPLSVESGTLTIGAPGTMNITSVTPGGVQVSAGSTVAIRGTGFDSTDRVDVEGANVVTTKLISSQEIDITLDTTILLDGVRVRVRNSTLTAFYYPYLRTVETGSTANPVIAATDPLFSRVTYTSASLSWNRSGTTFTGLAMQNPGQNPVTVTLQMLSSTNQVLQTLSLSLAGKSKLTEDLLDLFPQPPAGAASVSISSPQAIQLLGMQGDSAADSIQPVTVSVP